MAGALIFFGRAGRQGWRELADAISVMGGGGSRAVLVWRASRRQWHHDDDDGDGGWWISWLFPRLLDLACGTWL